MSIITVYLDSQDYSNLTDPKQLTPSLMAIHDALLVYARSGLVRFVFSSVTICEAVPLAPDSAFLAAMKAECLSNLCGTNALVSFDRLVSMEIEVLIGNRHGAVDPIDAQGTWFPDLGPLDEIGNVWDQMQSMVDADLKQQALPRQQRRAINRKLVKNGRPRSAFQLMLDQQDSRPIVAEIMKKYPMRPEHAELMVEYGFGRASEAQFRQALVESLRDPQWMMKWFASNHSLANPIAEIVRKPGREISELMRNLIKISLDHVSALVALNSTGKDPAGRNGEITKLWAESQESQLVNIARRLAQEWFSKDISGVTASRVEACCPGLATTIRSIYSSVWTNIGGGRKELPSDSQFVDALHALYAPYVDIFRADRFMAPHIQKQVNVHETIVAARFSQIVDVINQCFASRAKSP